MQKKIPINERTFVRSFSATKGENKISGMSQPYISGMYLAISESKSSGSHQMNIPHKKYSKLIKDLITNLTKDGFEVVTSESKYVNFIPENDIVTYKVI